MGSNKCDTKEIVVTDVLMTKIAIYTYQTIYNMDMFEYVCVMKEILLKTLTKKYQ